MAHGVGRWSLFAHLFIYIYILCIHIIYIYIYIYILEKEGTKARIEIKGREEIP